MVAQKYQPTFRDEFDQDAGRLGTFSKSDGSLPSRLSMHLLRDIQYSCANRDATGQHKTVTMGSTKRLRHSSQAKKRQVRIMANLQSALGIRTSATGVEVLKYLLGFQPTYFDNPGKFLPDDEDPLPCIEDLDDGSSSYPLDIQAFTDESRPKGSISLKDIFRIAKGCRHLVGHAIFDSTIDDKYEKAIEYINRTYDTREDKLNAILDFDEEIEDDEQHGVEGLEQGDLKDIGPNELRKELMFDAPAFIQHNEFENVLEESGKLAIECQTYRGGKSNLEDYRKDKVPSIRDVQTDAPSFDVLLFGRFFASNGAFSIQSAIQSGHSMSVDPANVELGYQGILSEGEEDLDGSTTINHPSGGEGVMYEYMCVNINTLKENFRRHDIKPKNDTIQAILYAVAEAFIGYAPSAKNTQFGNLPPAHYALFEGLNGFEGSYHAPFSDPVTKDHQNDDGITVQAIKRLRRASKSRYTTYYEGFVDMDDRDIHYSKQELLNPEQANISEAIEQGTYPDFGGNLIDVRNFIVEPDDEVESDELDAP